MSWAVLAGVQPLGRAVVVTCLGIVTLNCLLGFHPSQFQEHIGRQKEGWVKAIGMARPEVLLW